MIHPELRGRLREVFRQELRDSERAEALVLAIDAAWVVLGYSSTGRLWNRQDLHVLASLAAGVLEAERIRSGVEPSRLDESVRKRVKLRLIDGGKSVVASGHGIRKEEEG